MTTYNSTAILTTVSLALTTAACTTVTATPQPPQAVQTQVVAAAPIATGSGVRYSAVVVPDAQVSLSFRIPGYVVALKQVRGLDGRLRDAAEGDRIAKGSVLARIRSAEYEDRARQAAAQAQAATAIAQKAALDLDRATRLYAAQSLTRPDLDAARAQHDATQNQVRAARAAADETHVALRDTSISAPFDGDIVEKSVELGSFVGPGVPVLALARTDVVKLVVGVPDTIVRRIALGQPVEVTVDAFSDRTFKARISRIASAADRTTRNFEVEVAIPNRDRLLKIGMIGSLHLATGEPDRQPDALQVPLSAIVQAGDGRYGVYVVTSAGGAKTARLRPIDTGAITGGDIRVVSGLAPGDEVITTGATLVKDGQRVEVLK